MTTYEIKGTTDEVCTCDCCGRTDLKYTVIMSADGNVSYFGRVCAARYAGIVAHEVDSAAKRADRITREQGSAESRRTADVETARFHAFLSSRSLKHGVALQIEELGGFRKARELFDAA